MNKKRYSPIELREFLTKIIIPKKGKEKITFETKSGLSIAQGYKQLQTSVLGIYVEFDPSHIYISVLYFPSQNNHLFFVWHPDNNPEIDVLQPRGMIESTGFSPACFYIDPKDLITHGMPLIGG